MLHFRSLLVVTAVLIFAERLMGSLNAAIIIGNLPGDDGTSISFASGSTLSIGFSTGLNDVKLESVSLRLRGQNSSGVASLELHSDQGGNPSSTLVTSLGTHSVAFGTTFADSSNYTFIPVAQPTLQANITYWLTISTTIVGPNALVVAASTNENAPPTALASYAGLRFYDGTNFVNSDGDPVPTFQAIGTLSSAAVPEPTSWLLLATITWVWSIVCRSPTQVFCLKQES